jgi:hypothetical protein
MQAILIGNKAQKQRQAMIICYATKAVYFICYAVVYGDLYLCKRKLLLHHQCRYQMKDHDTHYIFVGQMKPAISWHEIRRQTAGFTRPTVTRYLQ